jgi:hypothetical protein
MSRKIYAFCKKKISCFQAASSTYLRSPRTREQWIEQSVEVFLNPTVLFFCGTAFFEAAPFFPLVSDGE